MVNGQPIEQVRLFKYFGRVLSENNGNILCVEGNLRKSWAWCRRISTIIKKEGAIARTMAWFYLAIVQAVLLYGAKLLTPTAMDMQKLKSFYWRAARYMTGSYIQKDGEGKWSYPYYGEFLYKCQMFSFKVYLECRRGPLWGYMTRVKPILLAELLEQALLAEYLRKIFWWLQPWFDKHNITQMDRQWGDSG